MKFTFNLEEIKYIKLVYQDNDGSPKSFKGAIKSIDDRKIFACIRNEDDVNMPLPQKVTLSIVCNEGLYRTETIMRSVETDEPYVFITLDTPQGMEFQQNREYFRIIAQYNCVYYISEHNNTISYTAKTIDISANGVSIILPSLIVSEEDAELEIMIKERLVRTHIKYVRSEKLQEGYKISFKYTKISSKDQDYISQVCIQKQLEQKRKSAI